MAEHRARIEWTRATESFAYDDYNRDHEWTFPGGHVVPASAAPAFRGSEERVDPEESFVAALSACHMLTFIAFCARKRIVVDRYEDDAVGFLERREDKKLAMTRVVLRPRVAFAPGHEPDAATLAHLHERSHQNCFIANSVTTEVVVE
jgi:organic hydroperoxide reductase OsmC/OhrA